MSKILAAMIAGMFAVAAASAYAADPAKPAAETTAKRKDAKKTVKAQGGPCVPGAGDSSAAVKNKPQGGDVNCAPADAAAKEPGRSGDPASAEKKK